MKSLPSDFTGELLKEVVHIQHLFTLTLSSGKIYRWTEGNDAVYYNTKWWISKQIKFENAGINLTSQLDTITLEISNIDKEISDLALSEDIRGGECLIERVLLNANLAVIGTPSTLFLGYINDMEIDRRTARIGIYNHFVRHKMMCPRRQHTPTCHWIFKSTDCGYDGNVYRNPTTDLLAESTNSHLTYNYQCVDDRGTDLCQGQTSTCSDFLGGYGCTQAFDGSTSTIWRSGSFADPDFIRVAFSTNKVINRVKLIFTGENAAPYDFQIDGSTVDSTSSTDWTTLDQRTNMSYGDEPYKMFDFSNTYAYPYYRYYVSRSNSAYASEVVEMELYGPTSEVNDEDYVSTTTSTGPISDVYGFSPITLSTDVTGISVTVMARIMRNSTKTRTVCGRLALASTYFDATPITPTTAYVNYDFTWTQNPDTAAAWATTEITDLEGFGWATTISTAGVEIRVSQCYIKVTNNTTNLVCDLTDTKCKEFNNRDNFGGFVYMDELATKEFWWGSKQKTW